MSRRGFGLLYALGMGAVLVGLASFLAVLTRQRVFALQRTQSALQARLNARSGLHQFCSDHRIPKVPLVSAEELAEHQAVAGFNAAENTLVFIKGEAVTLFQGFHELGHALHLKEVGNLAKYKLIPKKEREQWVLDWITSRPVWNHFNEVEKATQRAQPGFYP